MNKYSMINCKQNCRASQSLVNAVMRWKYTFTNSRLASVTQNGTNPTSCRYDGYEYMNSTEINKYLLIIQFFIAKYLFLNVKSRYCLWVEVYVRSEVTFL